MEYFVTANLNHDGKEYKRGDQIEFGSSSEARRLVEMGIIQTEPIGEAQSPAPVSEVPPAQPEVAGKPLETGEPSIDGREPERTVDNATDMTPGVAGDGMRALSPDVRADGNMAPVKGSEAPEPDEKMHRAELEHIALTEGVDGKAVEDAPNKAALVDLILENRKVKEAEKANSQAVDPEHDPSANL
jgi:hypothetical protein